jgi:hypothetical protein
MEFDKSKVLTAVTADQAKVGQKGWFADDLKWLRSQVEHNKPTRELLGINPDYNKYRFRPICGDIYALFYPEPEPTYAERQAQWVKENNVKAGTKVRVTRTFTDDEDGSCCWEHDDLVGMTGVVYNIYSHNLGVNMSDGSFRAVPYFALEVIKEPIYRPFKNAEEFKPYRDEWFRVKNGGGFDSVRYYDNDGVKDSTGNFITYQKLFEAGERENGEPCGVREEA